MYKNQLQELAQRSCFNLPSYSCVREGPDHAPRFKATVNFNGETFESPTFCSTLRLAEHAAAEVALNTLANRGPSKTLAARVLDETGIYKNLLQETAHRAGLKLPLYTTIRSGPGHVPVFSCTVELAGMSFSGEPARTKKQAQKNAAMAAWTALKQLAQSRSLPSTSTSSSLPQVDSSDEQDQVIIARVLASLEVSEPNKSSQFDHQRSISTVNFQDPPLPYPPPSYSGQHEGRALAIFPAEIAMYQIWQQQAHLLQLQARLCPFPISLNPPYPQIAPRIQSVFQEPISMRPGGVMPTLSPPSFMPRGLVPTPIHGSSMVKIQEIEEKTEASLNLSMGETQVVIHEHAQDGQTHIPLDSNRSNLIRPLRPLMPRAHRIERPPSVGTVVTRPGLLVGPRNQNFQNRPPVPLQMQTGAIQSLAGPRMGFGRVPSRFMAPAVQVRSVAPVCSAPPVTLRKMQNASQVGQSLDQEVKKIEQHDGGVSEASSGVGKLGI